MIYKNSIYPEANKFGVTVELGSRRSLGNWVVRVRGSWYVTDSTGETATPEATEVETEAETMDVEE